VTTGQRVRVSSGRVRIPDVTLVRPGALNEDVLSVPPLCAIEILSPDDAFSRMAEQSQDYRKMGIENIWLIDPGTRSGQASTRNGWRDTLEFEVAGTPNRPEPQGNLQQAGPVTESIKLFCAFHFLSSAYSIDHIDPGRMYMLAR
jgi:Uma2 family endonuclease